MKTNSKPHIWPILSGFILVLSGAFFGYFLFNILLADKSHPLGLYLFLGLLTTIGIWTLSLGIFFFKRISINDKITIIYPFRFKKYTYNVSEIEMYQTHYNYGIYKDYESMHFRTFDKKIFMIMRYEFWNYKEISNHIENNSVEGEISKYHNLKPVLLLLIISIGLTIGTIGIIELIKIII
jgi:hypothetical protein